MADISDFSVGDKVMFGRGRGEQTRGTVVKLNRVTLKVCQDEPRGTNRSYPVGTVWTVHPSMCTRVDGGARTTDQVQRRATGPAWKAGDRVEFTMTRGRVVIGTVKRVNRKTVSVVPDNPRRPGAYWRVGPGLLRKADEAGSRSR